jgi:hypothetical protein
MEHTISRNNAQYKFCTICALLRNILRIFSCYTAGFHFRAGQTLRPVLTYHPLKEFPCYVNERRHGL